MRSGRARARCMLDGMARLLMLDVQLRAKRQLSQGLWLIGMEKDVNIASPSGNKDKTRLRNNNPSWSQYIELVLDRPVSHYCYWCRCFDEFYSHG